MLKLDASGQRVRVDRCVCFDRSFEELRDVARTEDLSLDQLSERTNCCRGCGMCKPYVRVVLSTGRTSIPLLNGRTLNQIAQAAEQRHADSVAETASESYDRSRD
ncbi:MAG: (2Fe-2S)-binding protein [Planctomycetota bacterium]